jgi:hypothetical protein
MKDKFITREHFNYANKIIKILGFKSMCDFETQLIYSELKELEEEICGQVTSTMDKFKELFPLNEFDLRRIKYKFENIDQVIGFFKKLCTYLSIPYEFVRVSKSLVMRLPRSKSFLYNNYIQDMEMRENPQLATFEFTNEDFTPQLNQYKEIPSTIQQFKTVKSSEVLKYKKVKSFEKEYIVGHTFELGLFRDFMWINWIKIARTIAVTRYDNYTIFPLPNLICTIEFTLAGHLVQTLEVNNYIDSNSEVYFKVPIDFFNNHFYSYHNGQIKIKFHGKPPEHSMFKIIINGNDFIDKMPANYLNSSIECDHDSKYYVNDPNLITPYTWRIMGGMVGPNFSERPDPTKIISYDLIKTKLDEYNSNGSIQIIEEKMILNRSFDDTISPIYYWKYLKNSKSLGECKIFETQDKIKLKFSHILQDNSMCSIYFPIDYQKNFFNEYSIITNIQMETILPNDSNFLIVNRSTNKEIIVDNKESTCNNSNNQTNVYIKLNTQIENIRQYLEIELILTLNFKL